MSKTSNWINLRKSFPFLANQSNWQSFIFHRYVDDNAFKTSFVFLIWCHTKYYSILVLPSNSILTWKRFSKTHVLSLLLLLKSKNKSNTIPVKMNRIKIKIISIWSYFFLSNFYSTSSNWMFEKIRRYRLIDRPPSPFRHAFVALSYVRLSWGEPEEELNYENEMKWTLAEPNYYFWIMAEMKDVFLWEIITSFPGEMRCQRDLWPLESTQEPELFFFHNQFRWLHRDD